MSVFDQRGQNVSGKQFNTGGSIIDNEQLKNELAEYFGLYPVDWDEINNPEWSKSGRIHDWRNYVSSPVRKVWSDLSEAARICIYANALYQADEEEWD